MKNIFSKTTAEKRTQNGVKTDSKRTNYGISILIFAFLTLGFGQAWAYDKFRGNIYYNNSSSNWSYVSLVVGKDNYSCAYLFSHLSNTKLYYKWVDYSDWNDCYFFNENWGASNCESTKPYDRVKNKTRWQPYKQNYDTGNRLYFNGTDASSAAGDLPLYTATLKVKKSTDGGAYTTITSGSWPATLNLKGTYMDGNSSTGQSNFNTSSGDKAKYDNIPVTGEVTMTLGASADSKYEFVGWGTGSSASTATTPYTYNLTGNTTYYAFFRTKEYTVAYNGGANAESGSYASDTKYHSTSLTLPDAVFTRAGYAQTGWATSDGGAQAYALGGTYTANSAVTLYPVWTAEETHDVTVYYKCGATAIGDVSATESGVGVTTTRSITAPTIYGYTFSSWTLGSGIVNRTAGSSTTTNPIVINTNATDDYVLTANYTEVLTTSWKLIGDNATNSPFGDNYSYASGKAMSKKSGASATDKAYKTLNLTHTGTWGFKVATASGNSYTYGWGTGDGSYITFNRSKSGSKQDVYTGEQHQLKFNPDGLGEYEFMVDYTASPCYVTVTFPTVYTVTFSRGTVDGASGTVTAEYSSVAFSTGTKVQSGKSVTFKAPAAKTGYTFQGWYTANNGSGSTNRVSTEQNYTTTITADKTLYACYTINNYAITHSDASHGSYTIKVGDASAVSTSTTSDYGKTITLAATPATGYHFGSWSAYRTETPATTVTVTSNQFTMPDYAVTVGATFSPNTYRVQFHRNGASETTVYQNFTYDVAQNLTANTYTRTGYTFAGWATSSSGEVVYTDGAEVSNLTTTNEGTFHLYAKWTPNPYTVVLDKQTSAEGYGGSEGTVANQTVTFDATPAAVSGTMPTAAQGYGFMGFYSATGGNGRRFIDPSGNWVTSAGDTISGGKWVKPDGITLYAYYKQAEITNLSFDEAVVAPSAEVGVTPTVAPTPEGTNSICWKLLYNNGNLYDPQPTFSPSVGNKVTFTAPPSSGMYLVAAVLRTGSSCDGGTKLDSVTYSFQVAGDHTVTVQYKCGDETIAPSNTVTGRPLVWSEVVAHDIFGYTFSGWTAGDGVTLRDTTAARLEELQAEDETIVAVTRMKAIYDGRLTANYTQNQIIYFKNTLGWENVFVNFHTGNAWNNTDNGSGSPKGVGNKGLTNRNKHMIQIDESDVYYYDYGTEGISPSLYISFTNKSRDGVDEFWAENPGISVSYPANYADAISTNKSAENGFKAATPMFVPLADQTPVAANVTGTGKANYYNSGYWTTYTPGTGYTLEIYNDAGSSLLKSIEFTSEDDLMPMKAVADLEAGKTYKYQIRRGGTGSNGVYYGNESTMTYTDHGQNTAWQMWNTMEGGFKKAGITTTAAGDYTFNLSYSPNKSVHYRLRMKVDYPIANGDYRVIYTDNTRTGYKPSAIVTKANNAKDTVSFFIRPNSSPVMKIQQATVAGDGTITWSAGTDISSSVSGLAATGVYNICLQMDGSGAISVENVEAYTGNFYIRTDAANSKWDNYRAPDHLMTYSQYSEDHSDYTHYFVKFVSESTNVKFVVANDYSPCISDTLIRQTYRGGDSGHVDANGFLNSDLPGGGVNVRYMWDIRTNDVYRAYLAPAQKNGSKFLVLRSNSSDDLRDEYDVALTGDSEASPGNSHGGGANCMQFVDNENWIYEATVMVRPSAYVKLYGHFHGTNFYFKGNNNDYFNDTEIDGIPNAIQLVTGSTGSRVKVRVIYDFKTDRLVAAYLPSGEINTEMDINADVMFIREHQGDIAQLTFSGVGSAITDIKTAYAVMRFNKWTLNNKEKTGSHNPLASPASIYERSLYYVSFPFRVKLSEVFGFGTYGQHWIIQRYRGDLRAQQGYWAESAGFWEFIWNRNGEIYLEPNQGYILTLETELLGETSDVWGPDSRSSQIELFFPSYGTMPNITNTSITQTLPAHKCTIDRTKDQSGNPTGLDDTGDPRTSYNRTVFDSHWNIMSVPTYVNVNNPSFATTTWIANDSCPKFLYTWNPDDNTLTATSGKGFMYHAMHAYTVQYYGNVTWTTSVSPAAAPQRNTEYRGEYEFCLEVQQDEQMIDRTFVRLSDDEKVTAGFEFGEDMTKQFNSRKANIFTIAGNTSLGGNSLPLSTTQTTVVPVGVSIKNAGDYIFAIPEGTEGIGVTLVDNETGIRTPLGALDYTVTLQPGDYTGRFVLEISPIAQTPTGIEEPTSNSSLKGRAQKVMIDGILYIVKDGKIFDARGARVE